ncbi:baseplate assembly protein [Aeromonas aquatica]|uniref:baseplate assembly protein n=1 Tax=Aeromonas aquatica TaxID=558964 RepID=UPI00051B2F5D|nr:baseplate J/gp47 family protein [Aeromonas aquatica]
MAKVDLRLLPPLSAVKQMTYGAIQEEMAKVGSLDQMTPSDPAFRTMLAGAYREQMLRQDADDQVRAVMLATAHGTDLDHIGVTYYRMSDGNPVSRLEGEGDEAYRQRLHESPSGLSVAGPKPAYEFHAKSAHPNMKQALCTSPAPVCITMYMLGYAGNGTVTRAQCDIVEAYLWNRRPLTDKVKVESAVVIEYSVKAVLLQGRNPDPDSVMKRAQENATAYVAMMHKFKGKITASALHAVLMVAGVEEVNLIEWSDVVCAPTEAPYCTGIALEFGGWTDGE